MLQRSNFGNSWPKGDGLVWGEWRRKQPFIKAENAKFFLPEILEQSTLSVGESSHPVQRIIAILSAFRDCTQVRLIQMRVPPIVTGRLLRL